MGGMNEVYKWNIGTAFLHYIICSEMNFPLQTQVLFIVQKIKNLSNT